MRFERPPTALLERDAQIAVSRAALERAGAGSGSVLVIEGPAGIGKTELARAFGDVALETGARTFFAKGGEFERDFPWGVVRQLFGPSLRSARPQVRERLLEGAAGLAAPALGLVPAEGVSLDPTPGLMYGLYWFVSGIAEETPLLVTIDDAHWSDASSLAFCHYLARRIADLPVVMVLVERRPEAGIYEPVLGRITAEPSASILRPEPLTPSATAILVRDELGPHADEPFCLACHQASGGNPFLLRELLRELRAEGIAPVATEAPRVARIAPEAVSRSVLLRLARLSPEAKRLAQAVAVLGGSTEVRPASDLASLDPSVGTSAADELATAGIFLEDRPLEFVHPLMRQAVYAEIPAGERARGHARAARILANTAPTTRLAAHLLLTDPDAEPWVVSVLRDAAAMALAEGIPRTAIDLLERAVGEPPSDDERGDVLVELGRAQARAGDAAAMDTLTAAVELGADVEQRAEAALVLAQALTVAGNMQGANEVLSEVETDNLDSDLTLRIESLALATGFTSPDRAVQEAASARLVELLPRAEPPRLASAQLLAMGSIGYLFAGLPAEAAAEMAMKAVEAGLLQDESFAFIQAAITLACSDHFDEAERLCDDGIAEAQRRGSPPQFIMATGGRGFARYRSGRLIDAEVDCRTVVEGLIEHGWGWPLGIASAWLADVLIERGALDEAEQVLARVSPPWSLGRPDWFFLDTRGRLRALQGQLGEAVDDYRTCASEWEGRDACLAAVRSNLALALARLGEREEALQLAREEVEIAQVQESPRAIGVAQRALGLVEGGASGLEHLRASVEVLDGSPSQLEWARSLVEFGAALRRAGRRRDSREPLRRGLDLAHRCGATRLEQRAHEELLTAGGRPRRLAVTGVDALTPRERRVAQLAAEGRTNREIAQLWLFVSVRTVETHLTNAYQKLRIDGRQDLPDALKSDAN